MKTLHKIGVTLLTLALSLGLVLMATACDGSKVKINKDKETYVVGVCQYVQHAALDAATNGFIDALTEELAKEGRHVQFDNQNASGTSSAISTIINKFVTNDVDMILANATPCLQVAAQATETIPVLGTSITEYGTALGIKNFDGVVGGNVSGTSDLADLSLQAQMITTLLPTANKIGILYCKAEANSDYQVKQVKAKLEEAGKTVVDLGFNQSNEISSIIAGATVDAIYIPTDNTAASCTGTIDQSCDLKNIPVIAGEEGTCTGLNKTGVATLSISYYNLGKKTGEMAAKILLGKIDMTKTAIAYDESPVYKYSPSVAARFGVSESALTGYTPFE